MFSNPLKTIGKITYVLQRHKKIERQLNWNVTKIVSGVILCFWDFQPKTEKKLFEFFRQKLYQWFDQDDVFKKYKRGCLGSTVAPCTVKLRLARTQGERVSLFASPSCTSLCCHLQRAGLYESLNTNFSKFACSWAKTLGFHCISSATVKSNRKHLPTLSYECFAARALWAALTATLWVGKGTVFAMAATAPEKKTELCAWVVREKALWSVCTVRVGVGVCVCGGGGMDRRKKREVLTTKLMCDLGRSHKLWFHEKSATWKRFSSRINSSSGLSCLIQNWLNLT
jgi:hypothetical protein